MNGIDGFPGKSSIVLDARTMSTGARPGDAAGTHEDSSMAAAFGGHLADLSRQAGKASDPAGLAIPPSRAVPPPGQPNFRLAAKTAEAAIHGTSGPQSVVAPDACSTFASPQASDTPEAAGPVVAAESKGVRKVIFAESTLALGGDGFFTDGKSSPTGHRPVSDAPRDPHARSTTSGAEAFVTSPIAPGFPLPCAFQATNQAAAGGSNGTAASADAAVARAASVPDAMGEMVPLGAPPRFPFASRAAGPRLDPVLVSLGKPAEPHGATGMEAFLAGIPSGDSAAAAPVQVSARAPAAWDVHGAAFSVGPAPLAGKSALEYAVAQEIIEPRASQWADPNGGRGPDSAAMAPVSGLVVNQQTHLAPPIRLSPSQQMAHPALSSAHALAAEESALEYAVAQEIIEARASQPADPKGGRGPDAAAMAPASGLVVDQQTHLAPPNRLSPSQQIAELVAAGAGPDNHDASATTAQSSRALDTAGMAGARLSVSRVQTMQLQLDPEVLGRVTVTMRLTGTRLDLRVETERPETMQLIGKDKDLLTGKLQAAGYTIETLVIRPAEPQAPHHQFGANAPSSGHDHSTGQTNGGPSAHDRPSTHDDRQRSRPLQADDSQDGAGVRLTGGDLYI